MKNKPRFKQEFLLKETLPATGSSTSALTALGLLAVGSLVLLVHNMTGTVFCSL
ncbi:TPA: LPXTG cell wall anchor domain-containing protein [Streptococcus pneumoniae]|nr:LPXTG cell wall anchor domain-containing protein [Streptococcus pneumoniae]HEV6304796.1 LPXTG cell wall anchor domain-containing protein [Streptococcus pneumoniae]HEV9436419.1 LPXTG cell wall anchor domain-containing protein [Streptococcus pneumoniae]HEV9618092.1 LPXTG cell wall anchor domain-containing protein [Streptococcus pneumoniae]HEW0739619.1 LPXTG cell wall anchor domain-containing protein [Streptococcus pneumoniae]